jgi:hypothetical protein
METQNFFYYMPKERIANLLDLPSSFDPKGYIICQYKDRSSTYNNALIILYDYVVPEHALRTPEMQAYIGKMGTRVEIQAEKSLFDAKQRLNRVAKQFEI